MYQALYRKYRPKTFDEVIGQEHITASLKNQVSSGHLSHAYIFIGSRGLGKTSCARILAKAVNCTESHDGNPCCTCPSCLGIDSGTVMDVVELDAASNNGVENVRALREEAVFSPSSAKKRVYIIDEVHMLSTQAFNALLKILEEPPEHLIFILATTELQKVPATILSRCQRHSFRRISRDDLASYVETIAAKENLTISREAAELIAGLSEGGVRDALSMLDQCSAYGSIGVEQVYDSVGLAGNKRITDLFRSILQGDTDTALESFNALWRDGRDSVGVLKELSSLCRDVLVTKVAPRGAASLVYAGYDRAELKNLAASKTAGQLGKLLETLAPSSKIIDAKLGAELSLIRACEIASGAYEQPVYVQSAAVPDIPKTGSRPVFKQTEPESVPAAPVQKPQVPAEPKESPVTAAAEPVPVQNEPHDNKPASGENWADVLGIIRQAVMPSLYFFIADPGNATGELSGSILNVSLVQGFNYKMFSRTDTVQAVEKALKNAYSRDIKLHITEKQIDIKPPKDLMELAQFEEVTIINQ